MTKLTESMRLKAIREGREGVELRITLWVSRCVPACTSKCTYGKMKPGLRKMSRGREGLETSFVRFAASANFCDGPLLYSVVLAK